MKFGLLAALPLAAALSVATPAHASTTISLTGNSSTTGTAGNVRTFPGLGGLQVQATAWSYNGTTLERAYLGAYGNGLGVTSTGESGGNPNHAVDNLGRIDFILLVFNQAVNISSAVLHPYQQQWWLPRDNDVAVSYTNVAGLFTNPATSIALNNPLFGTLNSNLWNVSGNNNSPFATSLNSVGRFGNVWLLGAAVTNPDSNPDGFKLTSVTVTAVPEPGTWAMMLIGFGAVGYAMRRKRPALLPQAA